MSNRELTSKEKTLIRQAVIQECANYDGYYKECLPEDAECYMMTIGYADSSICRYFEKCILPVRADIKATLSRECYNTSKCSICGKMFHASRHQKYCSKLCAEKAGRKAHAKRSRQYRQRQQKTRNK